MHLPKKFRVFTTPSVAGPRHRAGSWSTSPRRKLGLEHAVIRIDDRDCYEGDSVPEDMVGHTDPEQSVFCVALCFKYPLARPGRGRPLAVRCNLQSLLDALPVGGQVRGKRLTYETTRSQRPVH